MKQKWSALLTMAVTQPGTAEQQYHGLALILETSQLNEGRECSLHFPCAAA